MAVFRTVGAFLCGAALAVAAGVDVSGPVSAGGVGGRAHHNRPVAVAAGVDVSGPVSAVVFDARTHSIRLVTGAPGSSILGATLVDRVEAAEIAPNGNAAIVM